VLKPRGVVPRVVAVAAAVIGLVGAAIVGMAASPAAAVSPLVVEQVNAFSAFDSSVYKSVRATCPAGKQVIGTGFQLLGAEGSVVLDDLIPDQTSVLVGAGEVVGPGEPADGTTASWQIEATALCVPISSMTLQIVSKTSDFKVARDQQAQVNCPGGTRALGMGQALFNGFGQVANHSLYPSDTINSDETHIDYNTGVKVNAVTDSDGYSGAWSVTAYAICGPALRHLHAPVFGPDRDSRSPKTYSLACRAGETALSAGFVSDLPAVVTTAEVGQQSIPNGATVTATEFAPGTHQEWRTGVVPICADGTNTPMVTPFDLNGRYDVGFGPTRPASIREVRGIVSVDQSAFGRPTGRGGVTDNNHLTVSFPDDRTYTATLVAPDRIVWSNGSVWPRISDLVGTLRGGGKCAEVLLASTDNGTPIQLRPCSGHVAQNWTAGAGGTLRALDKCLDIAGAAANGTPIQLHDCNGQAAQVWQPQPNGTLRNPGSGKCLDTALHSDVDFIRLVLWDCSPSIPSQRWTLPTT
jgi:hypothetical protein